jgi:preprotein translocase subunit SecE
MRDIEPSLLYQIIAVIIMLLLACINVWVIDYLYHNF